MKAYLTNLNPWLRGIFDTPTFSFFGIVYCQSFDTLQFYFFIYFNSHKNGYFKIADKGKGLSLRAEEKLFVISRFKWDRKTFSKVYFYLFFCKTMFNTYLTCSKLRTTRFPYDGNFRCSWPDNRHYLCYANVDIVQLHWVKKKVDFHHIPFLHYYLMAWIFQSSTFIVKW